MDLSWKTMRVFMDKDEVCLIMSFYFYQLNLKFCCTTKIITVFAFH